MNFFFFNNRVGWRKRRVRWESNPGPFLGILVLASAETRPDSHGILNTMKIAFATNRSCLDVSYRQSHDSLIYYRESKSYGRFGVYLGHLERITIKRRISWQIMLRSWDGRTGMSRACARLIYNTEKPKVTIAKT